MKHLKGTLAHWNEEKGYGFIRPDDGTADGFLHIKGIRGLRSPPGKGDEVRYLLTTDAKGRVRAHSASVNTNSQKLNGGQLLTIIAIAFLIFIGLLALSDRLPSWVAVVYGAMSIMTILIYWKDKRAAQSDRWRTPEITLQWLALLGGWPGAMLAQQWFRHKTRKLGFQVVFWISVMLHLAALFFWLSDNARLWLQNYLQSL